LEAYADFQVRCHPDAEDTPDWKKLLAALTAYANYKKGA
jgi:hypothetical protein